MNHRERNHKEARNGTNSSKSMMRHKNDEKANGVNDDGRQTNNGGSDSQKRSPVTIIMCLAPSTATKAIIMILK